MQITLVFILLLLLAAAVTLFGYFYQRHLQGKDAPEKQVQVTVLDKQSIPVANPLPGQEDQEFWIYVQKGRLGPKREFQIGVHYFHALNPGDKGILTYQGNRFIHFALER